MWKLFGKTCTFKRYYIYDKFFQLLVPLHDCSLQMNEEVYVSVYACRIALDKEYFSIKNYYTGFNFERLYTFHISLDNISEAVLKKILHLHLFFEVVGHHY